MLLLILIGAGFWTAGFGIAYRVLRYFHEQQRSRLSRGQGIERGAAQFCQPAPAVEHHHLAVGYFLARDLDLLVSSPVDWLRLYLAKLGETMIHSSWMVVLLAVPIFTAYGIVYHGGWLFPLVAAAAFLPYLVLPAVIGAAVTLLLVNVFPARRARDILSLVALAPRRDWCWCSASSARTAGPPERCATSSTTWSPCSADLPIAAERMGQPHGDELAHKGGRPASRAAALDHRACLYRAGSTACTSDITPMLYQGAGRRRAHHGWSGTRSHHR